MSHLIGIDLSTTNSCVSTIIDGTPHIIPSKEGERTIPSVVSIDSFGNRLVGKAAKNQAITNPKGAIFSIKRLMGTNKKININKKSYLPQEISAMILTKIKNDASLFLGEEVKDAVITVPAYFSDAARQATKDAGKIAGLNVVRIINEPTAAALAYGIDKEEPQKIMVFDFGGGTLDVSILDINGGIIEVLATAGNNMLGGDDFDDILVNYVLDNVKKNYKIDLKKDIGALVRINDACEKAKKELSSLTKTFMSIPFLTKNNDLPINLELEISRDKFDELTLKLVEKAKEPILQAINDSKLHFSDLQKVLLVGGSSRIPSIVNMITKLTNIVPYKGINPDECVAMGASIQGGVLSGSINGLLLLDVTPLSLGIMTIGDNFAKIIDRNTPIPTTKSQIFSTASPYQSNVEVNVLQGESSRASANKLLGKFVLKGIRRAQAGIPQIEVTFDIDVNGIVHVSAKDLDTSKTQDITIVSSNNLSEAEIKKAIDDAKMHEEEKEQQEQNNKLIDNAKLLLLKAKEAKKKNKENKKVLSSLITSLEKAIKKNDLKEIKNISETLNSKLNEL